MAVSGSLRRSTVIMVAWALVTAGPTLAVAPFRAEPPRAAARVDWAQFAFNASRAGYNPYETALSPETVGTMILRWQQTASGTINTSPAVWHGNVYVTATGTGGNGWVVAFNAATGTRRWAQQPQAGFVDDLAVSKGIVYAGTASEGLIAYDAQTGTVRWAYLTGGVVKPPAIAGGVAYLNVSPDQLIAIDAQSGQELWTADRGFGTSISAPAIGDGRIFLCGPPEGLGITAFDAMDGTKLWEYSTGDFVLGTPAVANGIVYAASGNGRVYALDAATGDLVWQHQLKGGSESTPAVADGAVYIGANDGILYALNAVTGEPLWSAATGYQFALGSPSVANGVVFVETDGFRAFDATTGAGLWTYEGPLANSAPAIANGLAYFGSSDTTLYAFGLP